MEGFYLLKPDMLRDKETIKYYLEYVNSNKYISMQNFYVIDDWITLSKILYEPDSNNLLINELKKIRKQLLATIKGYDIFYKDEIAILNMIDIKDEKKLQELYNFKKNFRKKFVNKTNKVYIQFNNEINLENKLIDIDINKIDCDTLVVGPNENVLNENYNMVFFNKLHFPDPTIDSIKKDLNCIRECNIINEKKLVKKLF